LAWYPKLAKCIHDNGGEFTGHAFQLLLEQKKIVSQLVRLEEIIF